MHTQYTSEPRLYQQGTKVFLKLPHENRSRCIGEIYGGVYHKYLRPRKHTHNITKSIGFCFSLIRDGDFRYVCVHIGTRELWTYREFILMHGHFQHYKRLGFEKQIFLNYSQFGIECARRWYDEQKAIEAKQRKRQPEPLQTSLFEQPDTINSLTGT